MQSKLLNTIIGIYKQNKHIFAPFLNVYLFGSVLSEKTAPNDIDILLIYSQYSSNMIDCIKSIESVFEDMCGIPVDLTILSINEESETEFLKKLNFSYYILK